MAGDEISFDIAAVDIEQAVAAGARHFQVARKQAHVAPVGIERIFRQAVFEPQAVAEFVDQGGIVGRQQWIHYQQSDWQMWQIYNWLCTIMNAAHQKQAWRPV